VTLSVCVVHWNTASDLLTCLAALDEFPYSGGAMEIVVLDNASTDGAPERVRAEFPGVRLIESETNRCFAEGTNQAVQNSTGELILLLNPDARVTEGALDRLAGFLQNGHVDIVAPRLVWPDGRTQPSVRNHPTPRNVLTGRWMRPVLAEDQPMRVAQPMASCLMLTRHAWETVGPMDPRFPLYFNDADWSLRAEQAGLKTWYVPEAQVIHDHGGTTGRVKQAALWESRKAWLRFNQKHFSGSPLLLVLNALIVLDAWRKTGRWFQSLGKSGGETTPETWEQTIK
jgi:N-acetylglucosaminyl-diphospho-decaprenol L-rhamnosyltransferase